jgi:hypothetical protein
MPFVQQAVLPGVLMGLLLAGCGRDARVAAREGPGLLPDSVVSRLPPIMPAVLPDGDAPHAVTMPAGVALVNGRIAIVDQSTLTLHLFAPGGEWIASAGGKGEGPGEFSNVYGLTNIGGDSIATWDPNLRRMSVFTSEPKFVRSERFEMDPGAPAISRLLGRLADGRFVVLHQAIAFNEVAESEPLKVVETANFLRVGPLGSSPADSAEKIPLAPTRQLVMQQPGGNSNSIVLAVFSVRQVASCERGIMLVDDSSVTIHDQTLKMSGRYPVAPPYSSMTGSDRMRMLEGNLGGTSGAVRSRALAILDAENPKTIRIRSTPLIDADGRVLHLLQGTSHSARLYQRSNVDGTVIDTLHLPDAHFPFAADARTLVAMRSESDTAESQMRIYGLPAPRVPGVTALGRCNGAFVY